MIRFLQNKQFLFLAILLLCSLPAILPLFQQGFFVTDDGEWMIIRLSAFYAALHDGQFPVRFLQRLNGEFGYPVVTFLYPGFLYAAVPFVALKLGLVTAIKMILGISLVGATIFTYLWLSKLFSRTVSFVGALFSLYLPYHLYDVYTRGSVGEVFALLWVPFVLWMMERKSIFFTSVGIFLLLLAHNSLALLFLPMLFVYAYLRKLFPLKQLLLSFLLGGGLASFFIIPAIVELQYTRFAQTVISDPTDYFANFALIGASSLFVLILVCRLVIGEKKRSYRPIVLLFISLSFLSMFFSSALSQFVWHAGSASFIQFPFRLLSYLVPSLAFLVAYLLSELSGSRRIIVSATVIGLLIYAAFPYILPRDRFDKGDAYYATNMATTTVHDEYLPIWVKEKSTQHPSEKISVTKGDATISDVVMTNKQIRFSAKIENEATIQVNTIYWPGWRILVDGKEAEISYTNPQGVMQFVAPKGNHEVLVVFGETPVRLFSDVISLVSLLALIVLTRPKRKK